MHFTLMKSIVVHLLNTMINLRFCTFSCVTVYEITVELVGYLEIWEFVLFYLNI